MIKINYFNERELLVKRAIETKSSKSPPNTKSLKCNLLFCNDIWLFDKKKKDRVEKENATSKFCL